VNRAKYIGIVVSAIVALALVWRLYPGTDRDYKSAVQANTAEAYKHFLDAHPDDARKQLVLTRMDELTWALTQKSRSISAVDDYIRRFPNGRFVKDANALKKDLALATLPVFEGHIANGASRGERCS
jgi:outer membrane protein assembly factor BamD (BamD/ComL family)